MRAPRAFGGATWALLATGALAALVLLALVLSLRREADTPSVAQPRSEAPLAPAAEVAAPRVELPGVGATPTSAPAPAPAAALAPAPAAAPSGGVRVEIFDVDGAALTDFVLLAQRGIKERREQRTDASGLARFEALEVGAWTLFLSDHERPLLPPTPVEVREGEDPLLRLALSAPLTELEVEVVDEAGRPAPNVALRTRCERGGVSRGVTDHAGRAVLRHVSLGPVRVFANDERLGRGNRALEIAAGERPKVQINLATRP
jgi:hypothetical protein